MSGPTQIMGDRLYAAMAGEPLIELAEDHPPPAALAPSRPAAPAPKKPAYKTKAAVTPKNIVTLAKARLRALDAELRRIKALEKERDELRRLIDAARPPQPSAG